MISKMGEGLNRHFSREDIQLVNKHVKKMLNITNKEMQIKTAMG